MEREKHVPVDNELSKEGAAEADDRPRTEEKESEPFVEDGRADTALDFTIDVLAGMGMDCTVDLLENDEEDPPRTSASRSRARTPAA
ncbi:Hypothetical protein A7982_04921 [Minicystis rosea]|nr:Hypothetical protein A7982_04921 [Minicystis rosea]